MAEARVFRGRVRAGRGAATVIMSDPAVLATYGRLAGLSIIPGTLNIRLLQPFDLWRLRYVNLEEHGFKPDFARWGINYTGEMGMHTGRVLVEGRYPAGLIFFTWAPDPGLDAELVSPHHLRRRLGLQDGDTVEFTLVDTAGG